MKLGFKFSGTFVHDGLWAGGKQGGNKREIYSHSQP